MGRFVGSAHADRKNLSVKKCNSENLSIEKILHAFIGGLTLTGVLTYEARP